VEFSDLDHDATTWPPGDIILKKKTSPRIVFSLSVPYPRSLRPSDFPLQLKYSLK